MTFGGNGARVVDVRADWSRIRLDPEAESDPMLADALRAMMAAGRALGDEHVRGALLIVDRKDCPRPRVPMIYVLPPSHWSADLAASVAGLSGDVFVFVFDHDGATWARGLSLLYEGPTLLG